MSSNDDAIKILIDCNGEILEATQNVPLLAVNGFLSKEDMRKFSRMQVGWAKEYIEWKEQLNHDFS